MGFYITLVYLAFLICSPAALFPEMARYRIQWWMGGLSLLATIPIIPMFGYPIRNQQVFLMVLFIGQIMMSRIMHGWFGGALYALIEFGSTAIVFFLLIAGRPSITKLKRISLFLVVPALYACLRGILAVFFNVDAETYILYQNVMENWVILDVVQRIRYLGYFNDPNDLAQYFLVCLPFIGLLWRKNSMIRNLLIVVPMMLYTLFGMYLSHSRGVLLGLVVLVGLYFVERVNKMFAMIGAAILAVVLISANFAGGRAISFGSGSDRIEAWGAGLTMLRENPLFGVGYNLFTENNSLTAHNSFVLCFAELGLIGSFIWLGLLISTMVECTKVIRRFEGVPAAADLVRWTKALRMSLAGFAATAWFLSRTYNILLYVLIAMWVILEGVSHQLMAQGLAPAPAPKRIVNGTLTTIPTKQPWHWVPTTATVQVVCIVLIYFMVRARWSN